MRPVTLLVLAASLLASCAPRTDEFPISTPAPTASPTAVALPDAETTDAIDLGIVLAPPGSDGDVLTSETREAAGTIGRRDGGAAVRTRVLSPPDPDFARDQLAHLAGAGPEIVCAVGEGARSVLVELAERHPRTTFCLVGGTPDPDDDLLVVTWDDGAIAFLAGAAAASASDGAIAVVATSSYDDAAFVAGVGQLDDERSVEVLQLARTDEPAELRADLAAAIADRDEEAPPLGVLVPIGSVALQRAVATVAAAEGIALVGLGTDLQPLLDEDQAEAVVVSVVRRVRPALERVLRAVTDEDVAVVGVVRLSVAEAVTIRPGGAEGAVDVAEGLVDLVERVADGDVGP